MTEPKSPATCAERALGAFGLLGFWATMVPLRVAMGGHPPAWLALLVAFGTLFAWSAVCLLVWLGIDWWRQRREDARG